MSLTDIRIPSGYAFHLLADHAELHDPSGGVVARFSRGFDARDVSVAAFEHRAEVAARFTERELEAIETLTGLLRPTVHELFTEALDATGWTGEEKSAWLHSVYAIIGFAEQDTERSEA